MKSPVVKRSVVVAGHKTSVSLEDAFWEGLKEIAGKRQKNLSELVAEIDSQRRYRTQLSESEVGHNGAHEMTAHAAHAYS